MIDDDSDFDPEKFKLPDAEAEAAQAALKAELDARRAQRAASLTARPRNAQRAGANEPNIMFVKFPRIWWEALAAVSGKEANHNVYRLALCLLHEAFRSKPFRTDPAVVKLTNVMCRRWGVGRKAKPHALSVMRDVGLVGIEERPKKSPLVTVRHTD